MNTYKVLVGGVAVAMLFGEFKSHPFHQPHIHSDVDLSGTVIDCSVLMSASATANAIPSYYVAPDWYPPWK
jgi:hypothetical protein